MILVSPGLTYLRSHAEALRRGWWFGRDGMNAVRIALDQIERSPSEYLERYDDPLTKAPPTITRWMWES